MKKVFFSLAMALMSVAMVNANVIWSANEGESWQVTWSTPLSIDANQFQSARIGNVLKFTISEVVGVIELKSNGDWLPCFRGHRFTEDTDPAIANVEYEWMIETSTAIDSLQKYGLEICGPNIKITQVELLDGKILKDDVTTIWTGFFWGGSWTTLELDKNVLEREDLSKYDAIRCYHECADNNFFIQFLGAFDNDAALIAKSDDNSGRVQFEDGYVELSLTGLDIMGKIAAGGLGKFLIQVNREGEGFNFTDVVLVPKKGTTTQNVTVTVPAQEGIFDMLGRRLESVETTGFYIVNGKKTLVVK